MSVKVFELKDENFFNFTLAEEDFGFDYDSFIKDGFVKFLEQTFIRDFIEFRKNYLMRNYSQVRFLAHKFKGSFKYKKK